MCFYLFFELEKIEKKRQATESKQESHQKSTSIKKKVMPVHKKII